MVENDQLLYVFGGKSYWGITKDLWSYSFIDQTWTLNETFRDFRLLQSYAYASFEYDFNYYFCIYGGSDYSGNLNSNLFMYILNRLNLTSLKWDILINDTTNNDGTVSEVYIGYYNNSIYISYIGDWLYAYKYNLDDGNITLATIQEVPINNTIIINDTWFYMYLNQQNQLVPVNNDSFVVLNEIDQYGSMKSVIFNNTVVVFGSTTDLGNEIMITHFDNYNTYIIDNYIKPNSRIASSLNPINSILCVFGGYDSKMYYNDLWTFDIITNKWDYIIYTGNSPSARAYHAAVSSGDLLLIFGGESKLGLTNDMFIYNLFNNSWTQVIPWTPTVPSSRKGSCMMFNISVAYIFGGENYVSSMGELWKYDFIKNEYTLVSTSGISVAYSNCHIINDTINIYGGYDISWSSGSSNCFSYNLTENSWNNIDSNTCYCTFQGYCMKLEDTFISFGGALYYCQTNSQDYVVNSQGMQPRNESLCPVAGGFAYYQSKLFFFSGAAYNLQGVCNFYDTSDDFGYIDIWEMYQIPLIVCSPGTYWNNSGCALCPMGTYKEGYNYDSSCTPCGPGKFNPNIGSNSKKQCYPCFTGTYTDHSGAYLCLSCPWYYNCNAGTYMLHNHIPNYSRTNIQPMKYSQTDFSQQIFLFQLIFGLSMFSLIIIGILFYGEKLTKIDMFMSSHSYELNSSIILIKTRLGGIFSLIFIVVAIILIITSILLYSLQNIAELKVLQPLPVIRNEVNNFYADIEIVSEFENYGDICESNFDCPWEITVTAENFDVLNESYTCHQVGSSCFVTFLCTNCVIGPQAYVEFAFQSTYNYASGININVTSTSSIPESNSSVFSSLTPQANQVYSGPIDSSFSFLVTPSLFISYVSDFKSNITGYHITESSAPLPGSTFYVTELANSLRLGLTVYLTQSDSGLYTERYHPQSFTLFISSILGSVAGILGVSRFMMRAFEYNFINFTKKRKYSKILFSDIALHRKILSVNMRIWGLSGISGFNGHASSDEKMPFTNNEENRLAEIRIVK